MNAQRLQWHYDALVSLCMDAPGVVDVYYKHDAGCPCESGYLPLPCCECHPTFEVNGRTYRVDDEGYLLVLERKQ